MDRYVKELNALMVEGHALLYDDDARILHTIARRGKSYIEVGTYCGGSAIIAGLAGCEVYCIDLWEYPEDMKTYKPTPASVRANWEAAGLEPDALHLYKHKCPPLPKELFAKTFDIGFIDGNHEAQSVYADWMALSDRVSMYMMFHDANRAGPYWAMLKAIKDPNWGRVALPFGCTTTIRILKRVGW